MIKLSFFFPVKGKGSKNPLRTYSNKKERIVKYKKVSRCNMMAPILLYSGDQSNARVDKSDLSNRMSSQGTSQSKWAI